MGAQEEAKGKDLGYATTCKVDSHAGRSFRGRSENQTYRPKIPNPQRLYAPQLPGPGRRTLWGSRLRRPSRTARAAAARSSPDTRPERRPRRRDAGHCRGAHGARPPISRGGAGGAAQRAQGRAGGVESVSRERERAGKAEGGAGRPGLHKHAPTTGRGRCRPQRHSPSRKERGGPALTGHAAAEPTARCQLGRVLPPAASQSRGAWDPAEAQASDSQPRLGPTTRQPDDSYFRRRQKSQPRPAHRPPEVPPGMPEVPPTAAPLPGRQKFRKAQRPYRRKSRLTARRRKCPGRRVPPAPPEVPCGPCPSSEIRAWTSLFTGSPVPQPALARPEPAGHPEAVGGAGGDVSALFPPSGLGPSPSAPRRPLS